MSLQSEILQLLMQRLGLNDMAYGYEALAEQAAQKNLPSCDLLEQRTGEPAFSRAPRERRVSRATRGGQDSLTGPAADLRAADEQLARSFHARGVALEQIERAIWLGCVRKYVALLNGQAGSTAGVRVPSQCAWGFLDRR